MTRSLSAREDLSNKRRNERRQERLGRPGTGTDQKRVLVSILLFTCCVPLDNDLIFCEMGWSLRLFSEVVYAHGLHMVKHSIVSALVINTIICKMGVGVLVWLPG